MLNVVDQADFSRMHYQDGRDRAGVAISPWALSPEKIKLVCAYKLARIAHGRVLPTDGAGLRELEELATARLMRNAWTRKHAETAQRFGGLLAYWVSVIYRKNNLRMTIPELCDYYQVKRCTFDALLKSFNQAARYLFPAEENHVVRPCLKNRPRAVRNMELRNYFWANRDRRAPRPRIDLDSALQMAKNGSTAAEIAEEMGVKTDSVKSAFRRKSQC